METKNKLDLLTGMYSGLKPVNEMVQIHALRYEIIGYCCDGHWDLADEIFKELDFSRPDMDDIDWEQSLCCIMADFFVPFLIPFSSKISKYPACQICIIPLDISGHSQITCPLDVNTESWKEYAGIMYDWIKLLDRQCEQFEKQYSFSVSYIKGQDLIPKYLKQNLVYFQGLKDSNSVSECDC